MVAVHVLLAVPEHFAATPSEGKSVTSEGTVEVLLVPLMVPSGRPPRAPDLECCSGVPPLSAEMP